MNHGAEVELIGISKRFGETVALRGVSFQVPGGKFVTLLGPSGCGKTTFLRLVAGFIRPDEGQIMLGGQVITDTPPNRRQIGIVFQNYALFPHMSVERNISFGLRMRHDLPEIVRSRTEELIDLVGLRELRQRYPNQLSGGQQQRVALARALAIQPRVLLLDEPFGALDRKLRLQMQVEVKKLIRDLGITTVFVTHDQEEALTMSDLVAVMNAGQVLQTGTPREVYDDPKDLFVADFVGGSNFIECLVIENRANEAILRHHGHILTIPRTLEASAGREVALVVRPEDLSLTRSSETGASFSGKVSFVRPIGPIIEYEVETTYGISLKVVRPRIEADHTISVGETVFMGLVNPELCVIFPR